MTIDGIEYLNPETINGLNLMQGTDIEFFYDHTGVAGFYCNGLRFL